MCVCCMGASSRPGASSVGAGITQAPQSQDGANNSPGEISIFLFMAFFRRGILFRLGKINNSLKYVILI